MRNETTSARAQAQAEGTAEETGPIAVEAMSDRDQALFEEAAVRQTWQWLAERYPDHRLTPDTSPQLDLGIDSLAWLNLSLELRQHTGIELTEATISRVQTVRDLLHAVVEEREASGETLRGEPLQHPDEALSPGQFWPRPVRIGGQIGPPCNPDTLQHEGAGEEPYQRMTQALQQRMLDLSERDASPPPARHDRAAD